MSTNLIKNVEKISRLVSWLKQRVIGWCEVTELDLIENGLRVLFI